MKVYKQVQVPASTRQELEKVVCDICKENEKRSQYDAWNSTSIFDKNEVELSIKVTVKHQEGSHFPEGSHGQEFEPDICPECFQTHILPVLKNLGVNVTYKNYGF